MLSAPDHIPAPNQIIILFEAKSAFLLARCCAFDRQMGQREGQLLPGWAEPCVSSAGLPERLSPSGTGRRRDNSATASLCL